MKNVFLSDDLDDEVFMKQPPGHIAYREMVCYVKKATYGLK